MPDPNQQTADFAARETQLTTREQALAAREQAIAVTERATARKGIVEFAGALVTSGQLLPAEQPAVIELLDQLESQATQTPLSFAAADGAQVSKTPSAILRDLLSGLPVRTPMGELAGGADPQLSTANFAAPLGVAVDSERLRLHNQAIAFQRQHPGTSYVDAVAAVGG